MLYGEGENTGVVNYHSSCLAGLPMVILLRWFHLLLRLGLPGVQRFLLGVRQGLT